MSERVELSEFNWVPCEQQLDMGQSPLRDEDVPCMQASPCHLKGNEVGIPHPGGGYCMAT